MLPIELPTFEATWWPLQMETIPGSGERVTVATLVRAATGQAQVRVALEPATLSAMFGPAGKGVQAMVTTVVVGLQHQLDEGIAVERLQMPFGGFEFGHPRDGVARNMNEVFDVAVRLSAGFGLSAFGTRQEVERSSRDAFNDWADRVQRELVVHDQRMRWEAEHFRVPVRLAARKKVQFAVLRGAYAANLGVLRPGFTSGDSRSLKAKVFDLEALRRDSAITVQRVELLVGCMSAQALANVSRQLADGYFNTLEFIKNEARARDVHFVQCETPAAAAHHIEQQIAA